MATLTNTKIKDTYDGLLKTTDNDVISASEKVITDGLGNASVLSIGTASASFSSDIEVNTLTIGKGANDVSTNTALGYQTLENATGGGNTAVGYASLLADTTGVQNTAVGVSALGDNTTGSYNTALGSVTLDVNTEGNHNVAIGYRSLAFNTTGQKNVAVGSEALSTQTIGSFSTAVGYEALMSQTTGSNNTAVGYASMRTNTTGTYNTAIGIGSLYDNTIGQNNTAVGHNSANSNTTGLYNTALGSAALYANETSGNNTALGYFALRNNTAANNTAVGSGALADNTTGGSNVAVGKDALNSNTTSSNTTAIGRSAMANATGGDNNTAVGFYSLVDNQASNNVAVGDYALNSNTTGGGNTAIGSGAGDTNTTGSNNIYIGYDAVGSAATNDNEIVIGSSATGKGSDTALIAGDNVYLGDGTLGGATIERAANPIIRLIDTTNSETFNITNNFSGGQINYNATTLDHRFKIGGTDKLTIGSSTVSVSGNLAVDTNTLYVDAANNRVGVGTSTLSAPLDVRRGDTDGIVAEFHNSTGYGIDVGSSTADAYISSGYLQNFIFKTNSGSGQAERMRIDSNGNVGIGGLPEADSLLTVRGADTSNKYIRTINNNGTTYFGTIGDGTGVVESNTSLKFTTGAGFAESMRIDSSGNVGINCSPNAKLEVKGNLKIQRSSNTETSEITMESGNFDVKASPYGYPIAFHTGTGGSSAERMRIDSSGDVRIIYNPSYNLQLSDDGGSGKIYANGDSATLRFGTTDPLASTATERMRIDSSGRVGIGVVPLTWSTGVGKVVDVLQLNGNGALFTRADQTYLSQNFYYNSSDSGAVIDAGQGSIIQCTAGEIRFSGTTSGASSGAAVSVQERMRITSGGDVLVGTTGTPNGTSVYGSGFIAQSNERKQLRLATNTTGSLDLAQFYNLNGKVGSISTSGSATAYNTSSDYRLKENVVAMTGALDRVDALKPSRFNFIADPEKTVDGFLAHEVQAIVPEAVTGEKDAIDEEGNPIYQGIDQSKIVPLLVGAIKELRAEIETLKSQLS